MAWYKPRLGDIVYFNFKDQASPAIVTDVLKDNCLSLTVFYKSGTFHHLEVPFNKPEDPRGFWTRK